MDAITRYLGQGSYLDWDEPTRQLFLTRELASKRPLLPHGVASYSELNPDIFTPTVCDTLNTFRLLKQMPPEALGA